MYNTILLQHYLQQILLGKTYIQHWYNIGRGLGIENNSMVKITFS